MFGGHNFYIGTNSPAVGQLVLWIVSFLLTFVVIGVAGFIALGIWWPADGFNLHKRISGCLAIFLM